MKRPKVCLVEWIDSSAFSGWHPLKEALAHEPDRCVSVGFIIAETDAYLTLLQSFTDRKDPATNHVDHVLAIPKSAITRTIVVRR